MPDTASLIAFFAAVIAIQLLPGPDMMLVIARGIGQGRKTALTCVAGISTAALVQIPALAFGVATIFERSPLAYTVLRYAGAAYLVYIGIRFLLRKPSVEARDKDPVFSSRAAFFHGFWGNLANPKSLIFLLAFLPQFVDPARGSVAGQLVILGVIHKSIGLIVDGTVAVLAGSAGNWLRKHRTFIKWQGKFVGAVLVGLGLKLAFDQSD